MARRDGDTALMDAPTGDAETPEAPGTNGAASGSGGASSKAGKAKEEKTYGPNDLVGVMIRVPFALRQQIEKTADEQTPKVSVPQIVTRMIADAYQYTLPEAARKSRAKYDSEEEKKAAQKATRDKQRLTVQAVLRAVEQGKISVDLEALIAELQAKEAAEEAAKAAAKAESTPESSDMATAGAAAS